MHQPKAAIAAFVKTPRVSPVKTRLAQTIGCRLAEEFYVLSAAAVGAVACAAARSASASAYWAVAEQEGLSNPLWSCFERVWQGGGELGDRLFRTYEQLSLKHQPVVLLAADSPAVTPGILQHAVVYLAESTAPRFTLGRAHDGGFYLVGGNTQIPAQAWRHASYGTEHAAGELVSRLQEIGIVHELPKVGDVDAFVDLQRLAEELQTLDEPLPEQLAVLNWCRRAVP